MASHVEESLQQWTCGPGGHEPSRGILIGRAAEVVQGQPLPPATIPVCARCGKPDDPEACLFCLNPAGRSGTTPARQYTVIGPSGREARGGLCSDCYLEIYSQPVGGWSLLPSATNQAVVVEANAPGEVLPSLRMAAEGNATASLKLATGSALTGGQVPADIDGTRATADAAGVPGSVVPEGDPPAVVAARVRMRAIGDIDTAINRFEELQIDGATAWEIYIVQYAVIPHLRQARLALQLRPTARGAVVGDEMVALEEARAALDEARSALEAAMGVLRKKSMLQTAVEATFNAAIVALVTVIVQIPRS